MTKIYITRIQDLKILKKINMFRFLPLKILAEILIKEKIYASYQAVARAVSRIQKQKVIGSVAYQNNSKILYLTSKGAIVLSRELNMHKDEINTPAVGQTVNYFALDHTLKLSDLYMLFSADCTRHNLGLSYFSGDGSHRFEYRLTTGRYSGTYGNKSRRYVVPDGIMKIQKGDITKEYFIEYDAQTEYSGDVAEKYSKYFGYYEKEYFGKDKKYDYPAVLFITKKSRQRILNLTAQDERFNTKIYVYPNYNKAYKNVVHRGLTMHEDIRGISEKKIKMFLDEKKLLFIDFPTLQEKGLEAEWFTYKQNKHRLIDDFIKVEENGKM
ncbi:hypothetical protein GF362_01215 [Candidatus Dojkabacteria bacterium]|nr:hypothetical protein [Candidatus Dojkabacteria bacterium]